MKILIAGSRNFKCIERVQDCIEQLAEFFDGEELTVITGGAVGVDDIAKTHAEQLGIPTETFYPEWDVHGKKAGILRNEQMVKICDKVICFWDASSRGTKSTIDFALQYRKNLEVVFDEEPILN